MDAVFVFGGFLVTTLNQNIVGQALAALKFEMVPDSEPGGPEQYTITDEALDALKGKTIEVDGDGKVTVL